jgi:hypothetical protein
MNYFRERTAQLREKIQVAAASQQGQAAAASQAGTAENSENSELDSSEDIITDLPPPRQESVEDPSESERTDDPSVVSVAMSLLDFQQDEALSDPEVIALQQEIRSHKQELRRMQQSGKSSYRRRNTELSALKSKKNQKARELWVKQQTKKSSRFGSGFGEYKAEMLKCSLPGHDTSPNTLTLEAKVLRAQHNEWVTDRQMEIVQKLQQGMIEYMYTVALPSIRDEHELAAMVGKSQVNKASLSKQVVVDLNERCLGLQRKIIAKYRLRELEHARSPKKGNDEIDDTELELLKMAAGDIPAMERQPELRDSAKARIEARKIAQEAMKGRKKAREEEVQKNVDGVVQQEKDTIERISKHLARLSISSVDRDSLLNGVDDLDSSASSFGNDEADLATNIVKKETTESKEDTREAWKQSLNFGIDDSSSSLELKHAVEKEDNKEGNAKDNSFDMSVLFEGDDDDHDSKNQLPYSRDRSKSPIRSPLGSASNLSLPRIGANKAERADQGGNDGQGSSSRLNASTSSDQGGNYGQGSSSRLNASTSSVRSTSSARSPRSPQKSKVRSPVKSPRRSPVKAVEKRRVSRAVNGEAADKKEEDTKTEATETKTEATETKTEAIETKTEAPETKTEATLDATSKTEHTENPAEGAKAEAPETKTEATLDVTTKTEHPDNPAEGADADDKSEASISSEDGENDDKVVQSQLSPGAGTAGRRGSSTLKSGLKAGRGVRSDLLDRARSARLNGAPGTGNAPTTSRVRPNLGSRAMSSRDCRPSVGSRGPKSRDRLSSSIHDTMTSSARPSIAGGSGDREGRMERLASRRNITTTGAPSRRLASLKTTGEFSRGLSDERRAKLRNGRTSLAQEAKDAPTIDSD